MLARSIQSTVQGNLDRRIFLSYNFEYFLSNTTALNIDLQNIFISICPLIHNWLLKQNLRKVATSTFSIPTGSALSALPLPPKEIMDPPPSLTGGVLTRAIVVMILDPPVPPVTNTSPFSVRTMDGLMDDMGRFPGTIRLFGVAGKPQTSL